MMVVWNIVCTDTVNNGDKVRHVLIHVVYDERKLVRMIFEHAGLP